MALNLNSSLGLPPPHIKAFLIHAARHSPYYRAQDWARNLLAGLPIRLQDVPVTPKSTVQENSQAFRSEFDPPHAGPVHVKYTSGSTGIALAIAKSASHFRTNQLENQRLLAKWKIDDLPTGVEYQQPESAHPIGTIESQLALPGRKRIWVYTRSASDVAVVVRDLRADFFGSRPSQALAILQDGHDYSFLKLIKTSTEAVPEELLLAIDKLPNCRHADLYGSVETALIACKCPDCGCYHLASANCYIEILDDKDEPAKPGQLGRVVATVFSNPAMPLIRYDLGDIVRYTTTSPCAPGQISLERVYGRERTIFRLPAGGNILPALDPKAILNLGIKRFKLVQTKIDEIEFRYQTFSSLDDVDKDKICQQVARDMSPAFRVKPVMVSEFPLAPSGKYLMHERLIP